MDTELEQQPGYYSILTASVRYDKDLNANEKILFSEITALSNKYGYCTASNKYFAELYQVAKGTVSKWITHLSQAGYLKVILIKQADNQVIGRKMYPISNPKIKDEGGIHSQGVEGYTLSESIVCTKKCIPYTPNDVYPIHQKVKGNNTSNNNTSINNNILSGKEPDPEEKENSEITQKTDDIPYDRVIKYLNAKAGTNYRATNKATQRLIKARFNEGMTTKDFKKVIDNKCDDWLKDPKMCEYLRPATLFGSKFESYLNQKTKPKTDWHEYSTRADTDNSVSSDNDEPTLSAEELDKIFNSFGKSENT
ncbi:conserved phage C-terminal domain-containing protein [Lactobacillus iners]|uniref:conserved phage C-terminal domain-containing protein n=1 Tax=Lactobacillus iners TaxID=147802 RepID=UPI001F09C300|nr:conserved phage C-terminal domain-containing protein [Lactobacillus iners]